MAIVLVVFAVVFLFRDLQVLAVRDERRFSGVFGAYAGAIFAGVVILAWFRPPGSDISYGFPYKWIDRQFALFAVVIQSAEFMAALTLRRMALGRYEWAAYILPSPVLLVVLFAFSFSLRDNFGIGPAAAIELSAGSWLVVVGVLALVLNRIDAGWQDRQFAGDFALMTSCTALIFVPFGVS